MSLPASSPGSLPSWARVIVFPMVFLALFVFFVFLGFPYDDLADSLSEHAERATGIALRFDDVSPHLGLLGPGLKATGVTASRPNGKDIDLDAIVVRPAWSLSWFVLEPAVHIDATRGDAAIRGTVNLSSEPGWDGEIEGLDLRLLPLDFLPPGSVDGTLTADANLRALAEGPSGSLVLAISDGSIGLPGLPVGIPFDSLEADVAFGGDVFAEINGFDLAGPAISAKAQGSVRRDARRGDDALDLDLDVDLKVVDPNLKGAVRGLGVRVAGDGIAKIRITGPPSRPQIVKGG